MATTIPPAGTSSPSSSLPSGPFVPSVPSDPARPARPVRPPSPSGWRTVVRGNVLMMGLVSFFTDASSEMIYPLLPIFFTGLVPVGLAAIYIGLMEGVAEAAASLLKIVAGRWSDRIGKRKVFAVAGYGLSSLVRPVMAVATAGWHLVFMRFLDRVGKGLRTSPRDALISDSVDPSVRGLAFSFHRAMDHLGAVVGPLAAVGILFCFLGYGLWRGESDVASDEEMRAMRWLFAIALVPGILATLTLVFWVREIVPKPKPAAPSPGSAQTGQAAGRLEPLPRRFYYFLSAVTLFTLGNSSDLFLVFYAKTLFHLGLLQVIGLWVALHISKIVFSIPGGILSDRLGRRVTIVAGWLVYALVYIAMAFVGEGQQGLFWALIVAYGAFYGLTEGSEKALVADFVASEHRGRAFGYYHGAVGLAALPASLLFGVFWAVIGPRWAFGIGAILAAVATVLLATLLSSDHEGRARIEE